MINRTFIFFAGAFLAVLALSALLLFAKGCGKGKIFVEESARAVVIKNADRGADRMIVDRTQSPSGGERGKGGAGGAPSADAEKSKPSVRHGDTPEEKSVPRDASESDGHVVGTRSFKMPDGGKINFIELSDGAFESGGAPVWRVERRRVDAPFAMSETEITQAQFSAFVQNAVCVFGGHPRYPAESVSWTRAREFCAALTRYLRRTKQIAADEAVDLPTEFQWEYAAKSSRAEVPAENRRDKSAKSPRAVKSGRRNAWGFFDMSGNVSEWCRDSYSPDGASEISFQRASDIKIVKGGDFTTKYTPPSQRCGLHKDAKVSNVGFRVVLEKRK